MLYFKYSIFFIQVLERIYLFFPLCLPTCYSKKVGQEKPMKDYLYIPKIKIDLPLTQVKKLVFALYKKLKNVSVVSTHILKKAYPEFRASVSASWFNLLTLLMDRDANLDKDLASIKHNKFPLVLKVLRKHEIFKTTEEMFAGDYNCDLSWRTENRRGDLTYYKIGTIGYCSLKCRWFFEFMQQRYLFLTANEMVKHTILVKNKQASSW